MANKWMKSLAAAGTVAWAGDCLGIAGAPRSDETTGAIVLTANELGHESQSLLSVLTRRVSRMLVRPGPQCPSISLRGPNTAPGVSEPSVYVDGTRAINTCILNSLNAADVERVEIYPMGVSGRPGYSTNANGLILVFLLDGA